MTLTVRNPKEKGQSLPSLPFPGEETGGMYALFEAFVGAGGGVGERRRLAHSDDNFESEGAVKARGGNDGCAFNGSIPDVAAGFDPTGQSLALNFGGASDTFMLDKNGRAKN